MTPPRHVTEGQSSPAKCRMYALYCVLSVYDYECVWFCAAAGGSRVMIRDE